MNNKYKKLKDYADEKLYSDYAFVDNIMYEDFDFDTASIKERFLNSLKNVNIYDIHFDEKLDENVVNYETVKNKLNEAWIDYKAYPINYFYTLADGKKFYNDAVKEVKSKISKII